VYASRIGLVYAGRIGAQVVELPQDMWAVLVQCDPARHKYSYKLLVVSATGAAASGKGADKEPLGAQFTCFTNTQFTCFTGCERCGRGCQREGA
jgi:hypothetical protein